MLIGAGIGGLLLLPPLAAAAGPAGQSTQTCRREHFEATVDYGPDAGLSAAGVLTLQIAPSGDTQGRLVRADGTQVGAGARSTWRSMSATATVGVGTADSDIRTCQGAIGGPPSGPQPADPGDWGYAIGGQALTVAGLRASSATALWVEQTPGPEVAAVKDASAGSPRDRAGHARTSVKLLLTASAARPIVE